MSGMDLAIIALPASALAIEVLGERNNDSASRQFARISDSDISVLVGITQFLNAKPCEKKHPRFSVEQPALQEASKLWSNIRETLQQRPNF